MNVDDTHNRDSEAQSEGEPARREDRAPSPELAQLQSELEAARRRINELAWALQSEKSEREEFKQRLQRERDRLIDLERASASSLLMDAVDEMDLALRAAAADEPLTRGVQLIRDGIVRKLQQAGLERLDVVGKPFDPNEHEAADMEITTDAGADQKVVAEVRAGYRLKDRVVRPARVKVARYVPPASA